MDFCFYEVGYATGKVRINAIIQTEKSNPSFEDSIDVTYERISNTGEKIVKTKLTKIGTTYKDAYGFNCQRYSDVFEENCRITIIPK